LRRVTIQKVGSRREARIVFEDVVDDQDIRVHCNHD
jgi:hypothetical protein